MQQNLNKEKPGATTDLETDYVVHCSCYDITQVFKIQVHITYECMCISLYINLQITGAYCQQAMHLLNYLGNIIQGFASHLVQCIGPADTTEI